MAMTMQTMAITAKMPPPPLPTARITEMASAMMPAIMIGTMSGNV